MDKLFRAMRPQQSWDDEDLNNHRRYILDNPLKWALDEYYLEAVPNG